MRFAKIAHAMHLDKKYETPLLWETMMSLRLADDLVKNEFDAFKYCSSYLQ